ncbi:MAG: hypothetical protein ACU0BF_01875 [Paracoccaceae bacterium]
MSKTPTTMGDAPAKSRPSTRGPSKTAKPAPPAAEQEIKWTALEEVRIGTRTIEKGGAVKMTRRAARYYVPHILREAKDA